MSSISFNPGTHDRFDQCVQLHSSSRSEVWKCWDKLHSRWVTVKSSSGCSPEEVAKLLQQAEHPNLVRAIGTVEEGLNALILDFVPGRPLSQLVSQETALSHPTTIHLLGECCHALTALEENGIVHGDLAPANVIVAETLSRATLIDLEPRTKSSDRRSRGTPVTMSPEVAKGEPPTHLSDIYSLGCLAYFMINGKHVFGGATSLEICWKQASQSCPKLSDQTTIPPDFARLVDEMLAKEPSERPPSASEIALRLSSLQP